MAGVESIMANCLTQFCPCFGTVTIKLGGENLLFVFLWLAGRIYDRLSLCIDENESEAVCLRTDLKILTKEGRANRQVCFQYFSSLKYFYTHSSRF